MDATSPTEPTALQPDPDTGNRVWHPPTIEVIDVPAQTESVTGNAGVDDGIYS